MRKRAQLNSREAAVVRLAEQGEAQARSARLRGRVGCRHAVETLRHVMPRRQRRASWPLLHEKRAAARSFSC